MKNPFRRSVPAKAVEVRPPSVERKAATPLTQVFSTALSGHADRPPADWARRARAYRSNPVVHRCVRLIAEGVSAVPLLAYRGEEELADHPLLALMQRPGPVLDRSALLEGIVAHQLLAGRACLQRIDMEDGPAELHLLQPDTVRTERDRDGWPRCRVHRIGTRTVRHAIDADGDCAIGMLSAFDPDGMGDGASSLDAAWEAIETHRAACGWNRALLRNSARPSGALVYRPEAGNLSDDQFHRLKAELEDGFSGPERAGRPLLLEGGLDWKAMGYSPKDMDFGETRHAAARDIALAFGVPPMLLGIPGDNTYANLREANRAFARQTLVPVLTRLADGLTRWLAPSFGDEDVHLAFDRDRIEGLAEDQDRVWKRLADAPFLSDAEKRVALGYSPVREDG